jgi:hypothetical protein
MLTSDVQSGILCFVRSFWNFTLIRKNDAGSTVRQGHRLVWLCDLYRSVGAVRVVECGRLRWAGTVARVGITRRGTV